MELRPQGGIVERTDVDIRAGTLAEADEVARLINRAYEAERFFVEGDRVSADDVRAGMLAGTFLVAVGRDGRLAGCVHVTATCEPATFGMLAVAPSDQGRGLGRRLIETAEMTARRAGRHVMEILVVNLRAELLALYRRLGYVEVGTEPYVHRPTTRACHFVVMRRALEPRFRF